MSSLFVQPSAATRLPKAGIWPRGAALLIDFFGAWLLGAILGGNQPAAQGFIFLVAWFCLRVVVVDRNQGQSLGHWALDLKIVDGKSGKVPLFSELLKREAVVGLGALLTMFALGNLWVNVGMVVLLLPLAIDCSLAFSDPVFRQAFHDRLARTIVIYTHRGYSLDRKVPQWFAQVRHRMR